MKIFNFIKNILRKWKTNKIINSENKLRNNKITQI